MNEQAVTVTVRIPFRILGKSTELREVQFRLNLIVDLLNLNYEKVVVVRAPFVHDDVWKGCYRSVTIIGDDVLPVHR